MKLGIKNITKPSHPDTSWPIMPDNNTIDVPVMGPELAPAKVMLLQVSFEEIIIVLLFVNFCV